ncbi:MAG: sugar phosphate nucleotidyltransferase [Patescibacteria group bacterium]
MQAVILAAGESSRFWPFNGTHKSLIKIMGKPIILYTIQGLINAGIKDIIVIQGPNKDIEIELKNYPKYKNIRYLVQNEPKGMGDALSHAKDLLTENFLLVLAERVDCEEIVNKLISKINISKNSAILVGAATDTPSLFGILKIEKDKVIDIVEKPKKGEEPSNVKALGIYILTPGFFEIYKETKKHQYDFEEALSAYMKKNSVGLMFWDRETVTLKYPWDLLGIKNYLFKSLKRSISEKSKIAKTAEIIGEVVIGDNVTIMEGVRIKGPCFIGDNTIIGNNALLRNGVDVGENCLVGSFMEVKNTIIMDESTTHSGFIGDSVIGAKCRIAAQFCTGNVRLDRGIIKTVVKEESVETGTKFLGVFIGRGSSLGIKVSTMPGIIIGRNVTIGPSTVVMKNIPSDTKYYTKFQEIISKKNVLREAQDLQKPIVLFDIDYTLFDTRKFKDSKLQDYNIYEEVMGILMQLSGLANLGIFSKGETEFQKTKLEKTGMMKFFKDNDVHIFDDKDANLINVLEKYKGSKLFLVDDKLEILYSAKKHMSQVFTIWVKRGPFAQVQKPIEEFSPDEQVENLSEIVRIVQSN